MLQKSEMTLFKEQSFLEVIIEATLNPPAIEEPKCPYRERRERVAAALREHAEFFDMKDFFGYADATAQCVNSADILGGEKINWGNCGTTVCIAGMGLCILRDEIDLHTWDWVADVSDLLGLRIDRGLGSPAFYVTRWPEELQERFAEAEKHKDHHEQVEIAILAMEHFAIKPC